MGKHRRKLGKSPSSIELSRKSTINEEGEEDEEDDHVDHELYDYVYTSLKDIILTSTTQRALSTERNSFDSSNICIRNELVKHAASMYIQSATIIVDRNQNFLVRFWGNVKEKFVSLSHPGRWRVWVREPLCACFMPIFRFLNFIANRLAIA